MMDFLWVFFTIMFCGAGLLVLLRSFGMEGMRNAILTATLGIAILSAGITFQLWVSELWVIFQ